MSLSTAAQILAAIGPSCRDLARRALLLGQAVLNGVDFIEFEIVGGNNILHGHVLSPLSAGAYGLDADPSPMLVHGGTRIANIKVLSAVISGTSLNVLDVTVDQESHE